MSRNTHIYQRENMYRATKTLEVNKKA